MADLITLSDYKISQGITSLQHDTRLTSLIASVSQLVKTYCNNSFVDHTTTTKTEVFDIVYGENFVQLTESPIIAVTSVSERDEPTDSYTGLVNNTDYYVDAKTDSIYRVSGNVDKSFKVGRGAVTVVYTAGYASGIPKDLQLAVIDLINYYHKDEHKTRQTIAGASLQNQGTTSQRDNVGFPDHIKRVLDLYKNF
jgi:hypothetical protein